MNTGAKTQNRPKILIATGIFPPQEGGPATYSKLLADSLPNLGFEVIIVNFGSVLHLPKIIRHVWYTILLLVKGFSADLIYAQDPVSVGLPALLASVLLRKKLMVKIVGDYAWEQGVQRSGVTDLLDEFSMKNSYGILVRTLKWIELCVARGAEKIIVPSNYLKKIVSNWGVDGKKITVIYNAFDVPTIMESKAELRVNLGYRTPIIVSAGRLVPWKGFRTLITSMIDILKEVPDAKLLIAGSGPDKSILEQDIAEYHLENSVSLLGKVSHNDLLKVMKASDVFVLNTSYEGFSHLILEALAVEVPIVTTRVGGNVEIVEDGKNGHLVSYDNKTELVRAITHLLLQKGDAYVYGKEGGRTVSVFTTERMLTELTAILNQELCES